MATTSSGIASITTAPAPTIVRAPTVDPDTTEAPMAINVSSPMRARPPTVAPAETWAKLPTIVS